MDKKTSIISLEDLKAEAASEEASIVFLHPDFPLRGKLIRLEKRPYVIGRLHEVDIPIDRDAVSRRHAQLIFRNLGWVVEDLQSTNGVYVNDRKVDSYALTDGITVRIGDAIFKFFSGANIEASYHDEVYRLTTMDGLTGAHNRRFLFDFLDRELAASLRHSYPLSVLMIDVDHFKRINDDYGHTVGDQVLKWMIHRISPMIRKENLLARYGGEEFAIVLRHTDRAGAIVFGEKVCATLREKPFMLDSVRRQLTVSIGVASFSGQLDEDAMTLIRRADRNLYAAKQAGRDRVVG